MQQEQEKVHYQILLLEIKFFKNLVKILSKIVTDINKSNHTNIRKPDGLQCFFTDCGEDGEDYDYKRTKSEVDRLVNWCNRWDLYDKFDNLLKKGPILKGEEEKIIFNNLRDYKIDINA